MFTRNQIKEAVAAAKINKNQVQEVQGTRLVYVSHLTNTLFGWYNIAIRFKNDYILFESPVVASKYKDLVFRDSLPHLTKEPIA